MESPNYIVLDQTESYIRIYTKWKVCSCPCSITAECCTGLSHQHWFQAFKELDLIPSSSRLPANHLSKSNHDSVHVDLLLINRFLPKNYTEKYPNNNISCLSAWNTSRKKEKCLTVMDLREVTWQIRMKSEPVHPPSMDKTPILDSRKSNRVLGPDGLPPAPSSSSSFLDLPLPLPLAEKKPKTKFCRPIKNTLMNESVCVHIHSVWAVI